MYIMFPDINSSLSIESCVFQRNQAYIGGTLFLQHSAGAIYIINCTFLENSVTPIDFSGSYSSDGSDSVGTAIAWNVYTISYILSHSNRFINNTGKTAVVGGICGIFADKGSFFKGI